ncbi:MAG TPA: hypothetical protein VL285_20405 [Bryobacteraceae bacterium]|nr:hypothetical protein [Bryobacteraceae bacterium]
MFRRGFFGPGRKRLPLLLAVAAALAGQPAATLEQLFQGRRVTRPAAGNGLRGRARSGRVDCREGNVLPGGG